jgi:hypothetical protein
LLQPQLDSQQLDLQPRLNNRLRKQPRLHFFEQPQQSSPQQSSGQPHEASQQPLSQQPLSQQLSSQPQLDSQQQSLLQPRLNRLQMQQPRLHFFEQPQQSSPQQSSGQPQLDSQQLSSQQPLSQPQLASQQLDWQDDLQRLNRSQRQQPRLHFEAQQQSSPQQSSAQQSSQQPQDFSQQHDGSHESQPQPLPSILSNMPAPKLWPVRQTLTKSAPNTFHLIEPRLLFIGNVHARTFDAEAHARHGIPWRSVAATGVRRSQAPCGKCVRGGSSRPGVPRQGRVFAAGQSQGSGVDASRANPWLDSGKAG